MSRAIVFGLWTVTVGLAAGFTGCSAEQKPDPAATASQPSAEFATDGNMQADEESAEIKEALAKLSPEDRALAEKQKNCPVTDEPLGSMGPPIKVAVEGREVFVCCEGCVNELKNNFARYEEKLPEA